MAENENFLQPKNRADDDMIRDFPPDFKSYVKNHLFLCQRRGYGIGSVFSSCKRPPPPHLFSEKIIDGTLIAPPIPEFMEKIKSYFKIILFGKRLCSYRLVSLGSEFDVDGVSKEHLGLHGRVYLRDHGLTSSKCMHWYDTKVSGEYVLVNNIYLDKDKTLQEIKKMLKWCSGYIEDNVYMLEFLLPPNYIEGRDPRIALVSLLTTMKQHCKSFKVASGEELGEELSIEVIDFSEDGKLYSFSIPQTARTPNRMDNGEEMVWLDAGIPISLEEDGKLDSFKKSPNCKISK
ncbi:unnamed protein product [Camellia sinensis]